MKRIVIIAAGMVLATTAPALAQENLLYNPSFEIVGFPPSSGGPQGWAGFNTARYRRIDDGQGPILVRTGEASIELASGADFAAYTTDVFDDKSLTFFNPPYEWMGGPVTVSGWYAIPADQPLEGANAGIKLEFRRLELDPPNFSIYQSFEQLTISGHTDGEWVNFSFTVNDEDFDDNPAFKPRPRQVSVLPLRFGSAAATGTIFWDDLSLTQGDVTECPPDWDGNGEVNSNDFFAFLDDFFTGDADFNNDGETNSNDFFAFLDGFFEGC